MSCNLSHGWMSQSEWIKEASPLINVKLEAEQQFIRAREKNGFSCAHDISRLHGELISLISNGLTFTLFLYLTLTVDMCRIALEKHVDVVCHLPFGVERKKKKLNHPTDHPIKS